MVVRLHPPDYMLLLWVKLSFWLTHLIGGGGLRGHIDWWPPLWPLVIWPDYMLQLYAIYTTICYLHGNVPHPLYLSQSLSLSLSHMHTPRLIWASAWPYNGRSCWYSVYTGCKQFPFVNNRTLSSLLHRWMDGSLIGTLYTYYRGLKTSLMTDDGRAGKQFVYMI